MCVNSNFTQKRGRFIFSLCLVLSVVCLALFEVGQLIPCMLFLMLVLKLVRLGRRRRGVLKFDVRKFGIVCVCVCVCVCLREPKKASKRKGGVQVWTPSSGEKGPFFKWRSSSGCSLLKIVQNLNYFTSSCCCVQKRLRRLRRRRRRRWCMRNCEKHEKQNPLLMLYFFFFLREGS